MYFIVEYLKYNQISKNIITKQNRDFINWHIKKSTYQFILLISLLTTLYFLLLNILLLLLNVNIIKAKHRINQFSIQFQLRNRYAYHTSNSYHNIKHPANLRDRLIYFYIGSFINSFFILFKSY